MPPQINEFQELNLPGPILNSIKLNGYSTPTPIQKFTIPIVLASRDMIACVQAGNGKTGILVQIYILQLFKLLF